MVESARFGTALYGGALYGVNPAWHVDSGVRWDFIVQTAPKGQRGMVSQYDGGELVGDLASATGKKATFRLRAPSSVEWSMRGDDPAATVITELATDVVVWRNGVRLERCRVGSSQDDLDEDRHGIQFSAVDYRGVLGRRVIMGAWFGGTVSFAEKDQAYIAWWLVNAAQGALPPPVEALNPHGAWLALSRGVGQTTGRLRDRTYPDGKSLGEAIRQLSEVIDGFDWSISPTGSFDIHYPRRGVHRDFVAHYGATVTRLTRSVDTGQYANTVRQSGAETDVDDLPLAAEYRQVDDLNDRPEGRWDVQAGDPDVTEADTLAEKAEGLLAERSDLTPAYVATLAPGVWNGPETLWLGDTCQMVIRSGRLDVNTEVRVQEIAVDIGDDGGETVQVTFDRVPRTTLSERPDSRLTNLERR